MTECNRHCHFGSDDGDHDGYGQYDDDVVHGAARGAARVQNVRAFDDVNGSRGKHHPDRLSTKRPFDDYYVKQHRNSYC